MQAIINKNGKLIEGDFKSLDGLTVEWQASEGDIPQPLLDMIAGQDVATDWDGFSSYSLSNTDFLTALNSVPTPQQTALMVAYGSRNLTLFTSLLNAVVAAGSVDQTTRDTWADAARDTYYLPGEWVAAVRGTS